MILREATIQYKGYDPEDLTKGSHKRVCCTCDKCGRVKYVNYQGYHNLCVSCVKLNKNNPFYGKHHSKETRQKMSIIKKGKYIGELSGKFNKPLSAETKEKISKANKGRFIGDKNPMFGIYGKDAPNWKGGISGNREHLKHIRDCIKLNTKFKGSDAHHIMPGVIIFIPSELHNSQYHDLKNNKNMNKINSLALNYLIGRLND